MVESILFVITKRLPVVHVLLVAGAVLLGAPGDAPADQHDEGLDGLFEELAAAESLEEALSVERQIWHTWLDAGDEAVNREMKDGIRAMSNRLFEQSIQHFTQVIEMAPDFAEGWNKRATAHYLNDELVKSMRDIQKTLNLEPRHFGAISGVGLIFMQQGDDRGALEAFEEVIKIYPLAPGANAHIERLRTKLQEQRI